MVARGLRLAWRIISRIAVACCMWSLVKGAVGVRYIARIAVWSLACGIPGWSLVACVVGLLGWSPAVHVWSRVVSLVYV